MSETTEAAKAGAQRPVLSRERMYQILLLSLIHI